jgi:hypothetical protein
MTSPTNGGSELCTQCGLCCTGAIHDGVSVKRSEVSRLRTLGFAIREGEDLSFPLPCPRHSGTLCSIYDSRPRSCARYRCQLLLNLDTGLVSLSDALQVARTARRLFDELQAVSSADPPHARAVVRSEENLGEHHDSERRLRTLALMHFVDRHFRKAKEGSQLLSEPLL